MQRIGITFIRMFAFAMAGSSYLGPIRNDILLNAKECSTNWDSLAKAYKTLSTLKFGLSWVVTIVTSVIGYFSLSKLMVSYDGSSSIWIAFSVFQLTTLFSFIFHRYSVMLHGMNYVALAARCEMIIGLLSVVIGYCCLFLSGGIVALVIGMQVVQLIKFLVLRIMLRKIESGKVASFGVWGWNREVFLWAWEPTWKGIVIAFTDMGVLQISGVVITGFLIPSEVASYLLTMNLTQMVVQVSAVPFNSITPRLAQMISVSDTTNLRVLFLKRVKISILLMGIGLGLLFSVGPWVLQMIDSNASLMPRNLLIIITILTLHRWFINFSGTICSLANNIVYINLEIVSFFVSISLIYYTINHFSIFSLLLSVYLPKILIMNILPGIKGSAYLKLLPLNYLSNIYLFIFISLALSLLLIFFTPKTFSI